MAKVLNSDWPRETLIGRYIIILRTEINRFHIFILARTALGSHVIEIMDLSPILPTYTIPLAECSGKD
jgi:hypothetical protein